METFVTDEYRDFRLRLITIMNEKGTMNIPLSSKFIRTKNFHHDSRNADEYR